MLKLSMQFHLKNTQFFLAHRYSEVYNFTKIKNTQNSSGPTDHIQFHEKKPTVLRTYRYFTLQLLLSTQRKKYLSPILLEEKYPNSY